MEKNDKNGLYSVMNVGNLCDFEGKRFVKDEVATSGVEECLCLLSSRVDCDFYVRI